MVTEKQIAIWLMELIESHQARCAPDMPEIAFEGPPPIKADVIMMDEYGAAGFEITLSDGSRFRIHVM
jgi:hypothetical protein